MFDKVYYIISTITSYILTSFMYVFCRAFIKPYTLNSEGQYWIVDWTIIMGISVFVSIIFSSIAQKKSKIDALIMIICCIPTILYFEFFCLE